VDITIFFEDRKHTRLDSRNPNIALLSTIAFALE